VLASLAGPIGCARHAYVGHTGNFAYRAPRLAAAAGAQAARFAGLEDRSNGTSFSSRSLIQSSALLLRITSAAWLRAHRVHARF